MKNDAGTSPMQWHDGLLLGHAPMDRTHEEFVQCVATLQRCPDDAVGPALDALSTHLHAHFGDEDRWMEDTQFPARQCHIDEHAAVLQSLAQVQERFRQGDLALCRRLADELMAWFPGHADYLDSALAHWLCKRQLGGTPVVLRRRITSATPPG